jgi:hypothetical protein
VATAAALGALEAALRVAGVEAASYHPIGGFTVYDPELGWRPTPGLRMTFRGGGFAVRVEHNAAGLRDRERAVARTPGVARLLALGDSFVWCWGVEADDCFTTRLERRFPGVEVIDGGVPAYSTAQELLFYERELRRWKPDVVLLVVVPNDPFENASGYGPRFRLDGDRLVAPSGPAVRRKPPATEWLQVHSRVWAKLTELAGMARAALRRRGDAGVAHAAAGPEFVGNDVLPGPRALALTDALLDRLADDVRDDGARLAIVLEEMAPPLAARFVAWSARRGVPYLDLAPAFAAARTRGVHIRLRGDPHVGPDGQAVVADAVADFLVRERLLAPP